MRKVRFVNINIVEIESQRKKGSAEKQIKR